LHLQAPVDAKSEEIIQAFLAGKSNGDSGNPSTASPRLFIWIPCTSVSSNASGDVEACASAETLKANNHGAIVFLNATLASRLQSNAGSSSVVHEDVPVKHVSQLSCMVISPRVYPQDEAPTLAEEGSTAGANEDEKKEDDNDYTAITLKSLQMFTRHCFVPAVRAMETLQAQQQGVDSSSLTSGDIAGVASEGQAKDKKSIMLLTLEDKLRQLDVALDQVQRTHASIAVVHLHTHPTLARAAANLSPADCQNLSKMDLSTIGVSETLLQDDSLLNELQRLVQTQWIASIQKVTSLPSTTPFPPVGPGSDVEEVRFWKSLEEALAAIRMELDTPQVLLSVQVLKSAKRFLATIALENNTGLDEAEGLTSDICNFLQQIPLEQLTSAREISNIQESVKAILTSLPRTRFSRHYGLDRTLSLLESITFTISEQATQVLRSSYKGNGLLLHLNYNSYLIVQDGVEQLWDEWDTDFGKFKEWFLEYTRKIKWTSKMEGNKNKTPVKVLEDLTIHHAALRERLVQIGRFRSQHERLRSVVTEVLGGNGDDSEDPQAVREVEEAPFVVFATVDVLDVSDRGDAAFAGALEAYDRRMDGMEERLARLLRTKLEAAADAEEMFRVFARFHPLLFRTRVRAAVKDFQIQLIQTVTDAITNLQSKFSERYETSPSSAVATIRGVPPVSGKILWAKQMERQVQTWMARMGNVLGVDWGQQLEGKALKRTCDELLAKLDATAFLRSWVNGWERELASGTNNRVKTYPILIIKDKTGTFVAKVNMDTKADQLFREVRALLWLGYDKDVPRTIRTMSDEALQRYPYANTLRTALRSYATTRACVTPDLEPLLEAELLGIRDVISEAFDVSQVSGAAGKKSRRTARVRWEAPDIGAWVTTLSDLVSAFEERVDKLLQSSSKVEQFLTELKSCYYSSAAMEGAIDKLQKTLDELSLAGFAHLGSWVDSSIVVRMEAVLRNRLEVGVQDFIDALAGKDVNIDITPVQVEIVLRNQEITCHPASPTVRNLLYDRLHDHIGVVCNLPKPSGSRFEIFDGGTGGKDESAEGIVDCFPLLMDDIPPKLIVNAYACMEKHVRKFNKFVSTWLSYQALWDTRLSDVVGALDEDIGDWQSSLTEARESRLALDASTTQSIFGPIIAKHDKVQNQVNLKYDAWQRDLQAEFAKVLSRHIHDAHDKISEARTKLENVALLEGSTSDLVAGVTYIQQISQVCASWDKEVTSLQESERLLKKERYNFSSDGGAAWMEASRVRGQYGNLEQILSKRQKTMQDSIPILQQRILAEDKLHKGRVKEVLREWEEERPLRGSFSPEVAMETLAQLEVKLQKSSTDEKNLSSAKDALDMEYSMSGESDSMRDALEELSDLKEVWSSVRDPCEKMQVLKDTLWTNATPRKIRGSLEDLTRQLRALPNRVRQYDAFTFLLELTKKLLSGNSVLTDLKTEALKPRHWKTILSRLKVQVSFNSLTVGMLWDNGILTRKKEIGEILIVAQGEMAIEVFLSDLRERWTKQELELVLYQNRIRLIKGWDNLFATLDDHMGGLVLMRSSPFYRSVREFQEEGNLWEDRLTKLRVALDVWVDVQRRWVYLEGILFGSADIKAQLPSEWSRFKSVDGEFVALMRKIAQRPFAMEALNIENLQRTLERLGSLMTLIQRALGEYLERQRSEFSRFYFLGDDDLLEIVGSSGEPGKVLSHVGKMFASIASATQGEVSEEEKKTGLVAKLDGMLSKDGEIVPLDQSIEVSTSMGAKQWLKELQARMQTTLAGLLQSAVSQDLPLASLGSDNGKVTFVDWAQKFPAQVMILAALVNWSMGVEAALSLDGDSRDALKTVAQGIEAKLEIMAETVLLDQKPDVRKKFEQLITELVHQRDVTRSLMDEGVSDPLDFRWLYHLRFRFNPHTEELTERLQISLSDADFFYGFEYLGIGERLVQTPLTDRCYLTLTQALHFRLGGNPFGPAGTGKLP
jgi:dynein heavy chain 1